MHQNKKEMSGLKQAAILAYNHLRNSLVSCGYYPIPGPVGLWGHTTCQTKFCVCVDKFGVKYWNKDDADHLCNALGETFRYTVDYEGNNYCELSMDWNCK